MDKLTVFLGGTCSTSTWRNELLKKLYLEKIEAFNPVVENWTPECQLIEDEHRKNDDICLYVITPEAEGFYSFVEAVDDSNKRPDKTILCVLEEANGKKYTEHNLKGVLKTMKLVAENGAYVTSSLDNVSLRLNTLAEEKMKNHTK